MRILIIGGVRSGKSKFAEELVSKSIKPVYIATAIPFDSEMKKRIEKHKKDRMDKWITIEATYGFNDIEHTDTSALLECLTVFVSNLQYTQSEKFNVNIIVKEIIDLESKFKDLIVVSNDIFSGYYLNYSDLTLEYLKILSEVHKLVAERFDVVIEMKYGIEKIIKGELCYEGDNDSRHIE